MLQGASATSASRHALKYATRPNAVSDLDSGMVLKYLPGMPMVHCPCMATTPLGKSGPTVPRTSIVPGSGRSARMDKFLNPRRSAYTFACGNVSATHEDSPCGLLAVQHVWWHIQSSVACNRLPTFSSTSDAIYGVRHGCFRLCGGPSRYLSLQALFVLNL